MAERKKMRIRTRAEAGAVLVQALVYHPMETGLRTDKQTQQKIPSHFIQKLTLEHNGKVVATVNTGTAVSADPLFGFRLKAAKSGDKVKLSWADNKGESDFAEVTIEL
jgi:sulfur-oxidizing protein SoxZ